MIRRRRYIAVLAIAVLGPAPVLAGEYGQNQAMGGAAVAVVADSSAVVENPAGMTQFRRYGLNGLFSRGANSWNLGASIVDSASSPVAMGVDYRLRRPLGSRAARVGFKKLQELNVGLAEFYLQKVDIGLGYRYRWSTAPATMATAKQHDVRLGIIAPINPMLRVGAVAQEFAPLGGRKQRDPRIDLGIGFSPHKVIVLVLDGVWHYDDPRRIQQRALDHFQEWEIVPGIELIALNALGLRAGWRKNLYNGDHSLHAGLGWMFPRGQVAYALTAEPDRTLTHTASLEITAF